MDDEALELLFDPDPFIASVEKMKASFDNFAEAMQKKDATTQKAIVKENRNTAGEIFKAFKKLAIIGGFFVGIYRGVKGLVQRIPEIGMAFKIAGDIFYRNFLWPLRRMLIPMLNNFLKWVRDNRVMFVQWGQTLVNIFVVVKMVISTVIKLIRSLIDGFLGDINKGTGKMLKNITELINVTLFKIAMILAMVRVQLEPIFKRIGEILRSLTDDLKEFGKGFAKGFGDALKEKNFDVWKKLDSILTHIKEILGDLKPLFGDIGLALGTVLGDTLVTVLNTIDGILSGLSTLIDLFSGKITPEDFGKGFIDWFKKKENIDNMIDSLSLIPGLQGLKMNQKILEDIEKNRGKKVDDAIITKDGKIIRTDPSDTIMAMKNPNKFGGGISLRFDNIFNITVSEGNAKNAGESFGMGLMDRINFELKKEYKLQGN